MLMEQGARTVQIDLEFGQVIYVLLAIHRGRKRNICLRRRFIIHGKTCTPLTIIIPFRISSPTQKFDNEQAKAHYLTVFVCYQPVLTKLSALENPFGKGA